VIAPPNILLFLGRFHLVLLHLPIGLILLLAAMEWARRSTRFKQAGAASGFILGLVVPAAALTALCGWLLSLGGGYDPGLLRWHQWTGIGTVSASVLVAIAYRLELKKLYRLLLYGSTILVVVTGHFGGTLTHGRGYLLPGVPAPSHAEKDAPKPSPLTETKPLETAGILSFAGTISPLLHRDCVPCHGPEKSKAKLRLDSLDALLQGGESGPAIIPGNAAASLMSKRLHLPVTDEDHMPPEGKRQPTPEEVALIEKWINSCAPGEARSGVSEERR
jgi:hypothetical protein